MTDNHTKAVSVIEHSDPERMSPVVRAGMAILQQSPSPETLRELLAVQREWEAGEARRAYTAAVVALKRDLPPVIARDKSVNFTGVHYNYASLAAVMDAVMPALTQHGLSLSWIPSTSGSNVTVVCKLTHALGHCEESPPVSAPVDTTGKKSPAQGVASTITLLSRYTALSLLGIATADMSEPSGNGAKLDPDAIDSARNLMVAGAMKKHGKTIAQAEAHIGSKVAEWTTADIDKLREWVTPAKDSPHDSKTDEVKEPKDMKSAARLVEAMTVIAAAKSTSELKSIAATLAKTKMIDADRELAGAAYKRRMEEVKP